jgi:hypothetical protein
MHLERSYSLKTEDITILRSRVLNNVQFHKSEITRSQLSRKFGLNILCLNWMDTSYILKHKFSNV